MISILAFVFVFAVLVLSHELGHFWAARLCGVRVFEFGVGFGPRLKAIHPGKTIYSLNLIPLGGFVKIAGLDDEEQITGSYEPEESYTSKNFLQKMFIIVAGSLMNIILAMAILSLIYFFSGISVTATNLVEGVIHGSPAERAGLIAGDRIVRINNYIVGDMGKGIKMIAGSKGRVLGIVVKRKETLLNLKITPFFDEKLQRHLIGINLASGPNIRYNPVVALRNSVIDTYRISEMVLKGMFALFSGHIPLDEVGGPVRIAQLSADVAKTGLVRLMGFLALLSVNLGILNLVPFPALDGGRAMFLLVEQIAGKDFISIKKENYVHYLGFIVLILFILFITYKDIVRIIK